MTVDGKFEFQVKDSFSLNDEVIHTQINSDDNLAFQLIAREPSGSIVLQYMGTKVYIQY